VGRGAGPDAGGRRGQGGDLVAAHPGRLGAGRCALLPACVGARPRGEPAGATVRNAGAAMVGS
jgi:hypothetical protein